MRFFSNKLTSGDNCVIIHDYKNVMLKRIKMIFNGDVEIKYGLTLNHVIL